MQTPTDAPLVEIAIAAHNAGSYLRESVQSALAQTYSNIIVTVVDDGSTDLSLASLAHINDPRLRTLQQPRSGKAAALNRAMAETSATFVAIQDADDCSHWQRIEKLVGAMRKRPDIAAVFSGHELIINDKRTAPRAKQKTPEHVAQDIDAMRLPAHDPTAMFRVSMVRDMPFDESLHIGQGYDHILRVGERFPMLVLGECLYAYRIHRSSNTQRHTNRRIGFVLRVIERACQRRGFNTQQTQDCTTQLLRLLHQRGPMNNIAAHFLESVLEQRDAGRRSAAIRTAVDALLLQPLSKNHYKPLLAAVAPRAAIALWQQRRAAHGQPTKSQSGALQAMCELKPAAMPRTGSPMTQSQQKAQTHV